LRSKIRGVLKRRGRKAVYTKLSQAFISHFDILCDGLRGEKVNFKSKPIAIAVAQSLEKNSTTLSTYKNSALRINN